MASQPHIVFNTDEQLALGEFGIQARLVRPPGQAEEHHPPIDREEHGQTMIYSTSARVGGPVQESHARGRSPRALLALGGRRLLVAPAGATIGRSRDCDIILEDAGISRRHAEIRPGPHGWTIADLHSTNGVLLNGEDIRGAQPLHHGDRLEIGSTEIVFELG